MKSGKIFIAIALCFTLLSGCGWGASKKSDSDKVTETSTTDSSKKEEPKGEEIKFVKKAEKAEYLLANGVDIIKQEKNIPEIKGKKVSIVQISGLVDKTVEKKINEDIEKSILEIAKAEIAKKIKEGSYVGDIHCFEQLNDNNILCINIISEINPSESIFIGGLLYNLTDGQRLQLKDIFTEGTDYIKLLNREITEQILNKGIEEQYLSRPFATISPTQNFVLSKNYLVIIFNESDSDFINRQCIEIEIPLANIDDYVDILDRYAGKENEIYVKKKANNKRSNNFKYDKSEIITINNGNIWVKYVEVLGLKDKAFEQLINNTIKEAINEAVQSSQVKALKKAGTNDRYVATVYVSYIFEEYGIIMLERNVNSSKIGGGEIDDLKNNYYFNLRSKQQIDLKNLLADYLSKNKESQNTLVEAVKKNLKGNKVPEFNKESDLYFKEVDSKVNYSFIKDKSFISLDSYWDKLQLSIAFSNNTFQTYSMKQSVIIPFDNIVKITPEEFFGTK